MSAAPWLIGWLFAAAMIDVPVPVGRLNLFLNEVLLAGLLPYALYFAPRERLMAALRASWPLLLVIGLHAFMPGPYWEGCKAMLRSGEFVLALFLPWLLLRSRRDLEIALRIALLCIVLTCLWALAQSLSGPGSSINLGREDEVFKSFQAAEAGMGHHNQMAGFLVAAICLATGCLISGVLPRLNQLALLLAVPALICSYSRGAWLGIAVALLPLLASMDAMLRRKLLLSLLASVLVLQFGPWAEFRERVSHLLADSDRLEFWLTIWPLWDGHSLWGWGTAGLQQQVARIASQLKMAAAAQHAFSFHLHNMYLQYGLAFGWPVWLAWTRLLWLPFSLAWRSLQNTKSRPMAMALLGALLAFLVQGLTDVLLIHARGIPIGLCWGLMLAKLSLFSDEDA